MQFVRVVVHGGNTQGDFDARQFSQVQTFLQNRPNEAAKMKFKWTLKIGVLFCSAFSCISCQVQVPQRIRINNALQQDSVDFEVRNDIFLIHFDRFVMYLKEIVM